MTTGIHCNLILFPSCVRQLEYSRSLQQRNVPVWQNGSICSTLLKYMHHRNMRPIVFVKKKSPMSTLTHKRTQNSGKNGVSLLYDACLTLSWNACRQNNISSFHWHVQNAVIPCRSQELLPFFPFIYFFLPLFFASYASILPHFVLPSISWSTSWSCCFQIHTQYSLGVLFSSILCTCPNQRNLCNLIVNVIVGFLTIA